MSKWEIRVRKITSLEPHPNADRLLVARVDGFEWNIIVGKDQFKVGDLAVYVPIESILPQNILDTVFKDSKVQPSKGRIKATRIRQLVSYGLLLTPSPGMKEGDDVAKELGIIKYEPPEELPTTRSRAVKKKDANPYFREYVDIENIKYYPSAFGNNPEEVVITEKVHGTNVRFGNLRRRHDNWFHRLWNKIVGEYEFVVGSRHVQQKVGKGKTWYEHTKGADTNFYLEVAKQRRIRDWLPKNHILFGEIYGHGVQDLNYGLQTYDFVAFDVMVVDEKNNAKYLDYDEFVKFCDQYQVPRVPELYRGRWNQDCLAHAQGTTLVGTNKNQIREGAVIKTVKETFSPAFGRVILKVISEDYSTRSGGSEFH